MFDFIIRFKTRLDCRKMLKQMINESKTLDKEQVDWKFIKQMEDSMVDTYMKCRELQKPLIINDEQKEKSV